eukprot:364668-Chlamydomonas_euryale.AAC.1
MSRGMPPASASGMGLELSSILNPKPSAYSHGVAVGQVRPPSGAGGSLSAASKTWQQGGEPAWCGAESAHAGLVTRWVGRQERCVGKLAVAPCSIPGCQHAAAAAAP